MRSRRRRFTVNEEMTMANYLTREKLEEIAKKLGVLIDDVIRVAEAMEKEGIAKTAKKAGSDSTRKGVVQ